MENYTQKKLMSKLRYEVNPYPSPFDAARRMVPIKVCVFGEYRVCTAPNRARFFTEATLPDFIKAQLGMLKAMIPRHALLRDEEVHEKGRYAYYGDSSMPNLGYRLSPSYFMLSLTLAQIKTLDSGEKGESNYGQE